MTTAFGNLAPERLARGIYWQRSWNIVLGCTPVSPGCAHCWSAREATRFAAHPNPRIHTRYAGLAKGGQWTGLIRPNMAALDIPRTIVKPTVFALWTDLFHEDVPDGFRDQVFARMSLCPQHVFLVLTKRPAIMASYISEAGTLVDRYGGLAGVQISKWPMPHVFLGATAEDQQHLDERAPHVMDLAVVGWRTWLSLEPLLGLVDLNKILSAAATKVPTTGGQPWGHTVSALTGQVSDTPGWHTNRCEYGRLHWIICGGETGPGARPMHPDWIRAVRDQCAEAEIPFLFKQWGEWGTTRIDLRTNAPAWDLFHDFNHYCNKAPTRMRKGDKLICPDGHVPTHGGRDGKTFPMAVITRVGKKRAGRQIDGQTWNGLPNL